VLKYVIVENSRFKAFGISVGVVDRAKSKSRKIAQLPFFLIRQQFGEKLAKSAQKLG
jgi:hypothetical protein